MIWRDWKGEVVKLNKSVMKWKKIWYKETDVVKLKNVKRWNEETENVKLWNQKSEMKRSKMWNCEIKNKLNVENEKMKWRAWIGETNKLKRLKCKDEIKR